MNLELTIEEIHHAYESGSLSSLELTKSYLADIKQHAGLGAVICINPDAETIAAELDNEWQQGKRRGPLHGIPLLLKDNIDTHDAMPTTAGSVLLANHFPGQDAEIVTKLRDAGVVILGKTNLSEWANFRSNHSVSGWSSLGGQTRNPYDEFRSPSGSSAGSGVAVAANLTSIAVGTETDGSVIAPAALNGIVGIKPTQGTISAKGIVPISHSQDTAGPMARTLTDAVLLLEAMLTTPQDLASHLIKNGLNAKKLAVVSNLKGYHPATDIVFYQAVEVMTSEGAVISETRINHMRETNRYEYEVLLTEFQAGIEAYLSTTELPYRNLHDLIEANLAHPQILSVFGQDVFIAAAERGNLDAEPYQTALRESRRLAREGIDQALEQSNADILIAPSVGPAWTIDPLNGDHGLGGATMVPAVAGYPHITVPMGFVGGMPVGLSFIGKANAEARLLEAAYGFEQATLHRRPPNL